MLRLYVSRQVEYVPLHFCVSLPTCSCSHIAQSSYVSVQQCWAVQQSKRMLMVEDLTVGILLNTKDRWSNSLIKDHCLTNIAATCISHFSAQSAACLVSLITWGMGLSIVHHNWTFPLLTITWNICHIHTYHTNWANTHWYILKVCAALTSPLLYPTLVCHSLPQLQFLLVYYILTPIYTSCRFIEYIVHKQALWQTWLCHSRASRIC